MQTIKTLKIDNTKTLKIVYDLDSSYLWEEEFQEVTFISNHKNFKNEGPLKNYSLEDLNELKEQNKELKIVPVFGLEHGNFALSVSDFRDPWDSGLFGFLVFKAADFGPDFEKSFVRSMEQLINGEVYGFQVVQTEVCSLGHKHEEVLDSCYGFYGFQNERELIETVLDHIDLTKEQRTELLKAV